MQDIHNLLRTLGCALALVMGAHAPVASAQQPPIKIVVGALPGGSTDTLTREIGESMGAIAD